MYDSFGAIVEGNTVTFNLFFPDKEVDPSQYIQGGSPQIHSIIVIGSFQSYYGFSNWIPDNHFIMEKRQHPNGWLYILNLQNLPEGFFEYKYYVTFKNGEQRFVCDPVSRYGGSDENENSAFVVGGGRTDVIPLINRLPAKDLIIYEVNLNDFVHEFKGKRAPVDAFWDKLDYLQDLGINAIEFMPLTAWPGSHFSWGYDPFSFFSIEHRYLNDASEPMNKLYKLKNLFNEIHRREIHIIMDGVFNHVRVDTNSPGNGFGYYWLYQNPEDSPFIGQFGRGGFFEELNFNNNCVSQFVFDVCRYWIDVFKIDGIRFDYTIGFIEHDKLNIGIGRLIQDLNEFLANKQLLNVSLFLEHLTDDRYLAIRDCNALNATGCWFDPFMYSNFNFAREGRLYNSALRILNSNMDFAEEKVPVTYIQNHDHSTISQEVGGRHLWFKTQAPAIALLTSPGSVLIHNGQEFGQQEYLPHDGYDRVIPRPLRWGQESPESGDFIGNRLFNLYKRLIDIRLKHPGLRAPNMYPFPESENGYGLLENNQIVVFHRYGISNEAKEEYFIIAINYSGNRLNIDIPFSKNGIWTDLLNDERVEVNEYQLTRYQINSHWGAIFFYQMD